MFTINQITKLLIKSLAAGAVLTSQAVTMSQTPLLTQKGSVEPNLVLMFDDSASMPAQFIYQYGGSEGVYGRDGPGSSSNSATCASTLSMTTTCTYNSPSSTEYAQLSPDVNGLYYDPRIRYKPRITYDGSTTAALTAVGTPPTTDFYVYFYKNGSGANVPWVGPTVTTAYPDPLLSGAYFSGSTYVPGTSLLISGATTGLAYPTKITTGGGPYPRFINRTDCNAGAATGGSCSLTEERLNYAIWKKYHSNRLDLAKTGLGYAFQDLTATLRLGWGLINTLDGGVLDSGVGLYNTTRKADFYTWLYARTGTVPGTPNRKALKAVGDYYSRSDNKGPWATTPDPTSTGTSTLSNTAAGDTTAIRTAHYSCRRSYAMLVTDGYYNDSSSGLSPTEIDSTSLSSAITGSTATGTALSFNYSSAGTVTTINNGVTTTKTNKSYPGGGSDTLADVAMKYWITDLRSGTDGIANKVKIIPDSVINGVTTKGNESFWQNMSFYAVGLGIAGTLPQTTTTLANLVAGTANTTTTGTSVTGWPTATTNAEESVDDMWHATINGRGRLLSAKNSDTLSDAVEGMLAEINRDTSSQSGVAASTISLTSATNKYTPKYTTGSWTGNVVASDLDAGSGAELCTLWKVVGPIDSALDKPSCSSTTTWSGIAAHTSRNIYAWNGAAMGNFNTSNTYVTSNVVGGTSANLINYLRGDQTNEDPNGTSQYRAREVVLGDIVNSTPTFIQGALDMRLAKDVSTAVISTVDMYATAGYGTFVTTKTARSPGVLFAGANDGMLHGFNGDTGAEVFAFVPRAVMPNMHLLASRSYNHTYYVDGPTVEADACFSGGDSCTTWSNLLLGSAGAGGKTVFALNVTNPMSMTASSLKWEITPTTVSTATTSTTTTDYANLGNILNDVQTGLTVGGQWVAIFGNGYTGADGKAHLYVANLDTGALIADISAGVASNNGLGGVRLVRDTKKRIIGAYAGDLNGSLWKFDLSSSSPSSWITGMPQLLYKTLLSPVQPITATPTVVKHPTSGNVVAFGTGKFFESTDLSNSDVQALYGVWDNVAFGAASPTVVTQVDKTNLVQQTISAAITGTYIVTAADLSTSTAALNYYSVSRNAIDWTTQKGWYINLTNTGQRTIFPLETLVGSIAAVDTISPSNVSLDPCLVTGTGKAWNYVIDMATGSGPSAAIFDTNGSGTITTADLLVSGYENAADGRTRYIKNEAKSTSTSTYFTPLSTQQLPGFGISCVVSGTCSNPTATVLKRTWRQLFLR